MKLHLPVRLFRAILATMMVFSSFALASEKSDSYEQIEIWSSSYLNEYTLNNTDDYYCFILYADVSFTPTLNISWTATTPLLKGGHLYFTSSDKDCPSNVSFEAGDSRVFDGQSSLIFEELGG